jgi:hypothetical protein
MNYNVFEVALSKPRLDRYLIACSGNQRKAIRLYRLNIKLSQSFFALIGIFEVILRNSIDNHYKSELGDPEWLLNATTPTGMFSNPVFTRGKFETKRKITTAKNELLKPYTHDRLVAALSFGFWTNLFDRLQFRVGGKSLHKIFINRPIGTSQLTLYKKLTKLRNFRNRIAHLEPICFNNLHQIDLTYAKNHYQLTIEMVQWLGYDNHLIFKKINSVNCIVRKLNWLR